MPRPTVSKGGAKVIQAAVDNLFDRLKLRVLGPDYVKTRGDKEIRVNYRPDFSIPGLYRQAAAEEGTKADETTLNGSVRIAEAYLDAEREKTKARVLKAVQSWLATSKVKTDMETVLGGELADVWGQMKTSVDKIVDTEATTARNMGTLEGIVKVAAASNVDDPSVFFMVVRDGELCKECERIHLMPDKVTPRIFKLSEVSNGFHKRGTETPCISGLHPQCRCTLTYLSRGYGFDKAGRVKYIEEGHDQLAGQSASSETRT